jgi:hypothetical protein
MRKLILALLVLVGVAHATVRTAATCAAADFNTQITASADGDTVQGPASPGTVTWSTNITFTKNIILNGRGCIVTSSGSNIINATTTATASTHLEIENFTFNGTANGKVTVRFSPTGQTWLVHDNTFNGCDACIQTNGFGGGVIYHNTLTDATALAEEITINGGGGPSDMTGRTNDVTPGGLNLVYIEGNTITGTTTSNYAFFQTYYGGRFVARFNDFINAGVETHGSSPGTCTGENGARWFEFYNNHHTHPNGNTVPIKIRGGSGIIFGNDTTVSGQNIILTDDCPSGTWPIQAMLSQGIEPAASTGTSTSDPTKWNPLYAWNNPGFTALVQGTTLVQVGSAALVCSNPGSKCDGIVTTPAKTFPTSLLRCESAADVTAGCPVTYSYSPAACPNPATGLSGTCNYAVVGASGYAVAGNVTYIVNNSNAPGGSGPNCADTAGQAGTLAAPFCTLSFALTRMASGDTVQMRTGTYPMTSGFLLVQGPSGTSGAHTVITKFPGDNPHITGVTTGSGFRLQNIQFMDISGLEISGAEEETQVEGGSNITFSNMNIHDAQGACNYIKKCTSAFCSGAVPSNVTWSNSTINNCGLDTTTNGDGFYLGTSGDNTDTTNHVTLQGNTITNTQTECVNVKDFTNNTVIDSNVCDHNSLGNNQFVDSAIMLKSSTPTNTANDFVTNNVISNTGPGSTCNLTPSCTAVNSAIRLQHQATVYNNIIYGPNLASLGFAFYTDNSDTRLIYQNTADVTAARFLNVASGSTPTVTNNFGYNVGTNLAFNAAFVANQAAHDYHLTAHHASTTNVNTVAPLDKDGVTRPALPDFGAYQSVAAATFSISGALGSQGANATVTYSGTATGSVVANASGNYTIPSLGNGNYTIIPTGVVWTFKPRSIAVIVASGNVTGVNFTAFPPDITQLPQIWVNSLEYVGTTVNVINFPSVGTGGGWTCGATTFPAYTADSWTSLQQAINDAETCRTSNGTGTTIFIPAGHVFTAPGLTGLTLPQTVNDNSTNFIILTSTAPLPLGRTVCSHGIQDNVPQSTQPGIRNVGCNATQMSYQLGTVVTPVSGAFTLANGVNTNTSAYNDVASMWELNGGNNQILTAMWDSNFIGPHHYAILNANIHPSPGDTSNQAIIKFGQESETLESELAHHMHVAYTYIHGDAQDAPVVAGVAVGGGTGFNVIPHGIDYNCVQCSDSYMYGDQMWRPGNEGQVVSILYGKQIKQVHNWFEGETETTMTGGFAANVSIPNFDVGSDMEDRGNRFSYPYSWVLAQAAGFDPNSVYPTTGGTGGSTGATVHLQTTNGAPNQQGIVTVSPMNNGSGYALNDVLTLSSPYDAGGVGGTVLVTSLGAGNSVTGITVVSGTGYHVQNGLATTVNTGTGVGATINITSVSPAGGITGITLGSGGTSGTYTASNVLTVTQAGGSGGNIAVNTVSAGVITSVSVQAGTGYSLNGYVRKNAHEGKFNNRIVIDGDILENGDFSGGQGQVISSKANQTSAVGGGINYWTTQMNNTITNNIIRNDCSGTSQGFRSNNGVGAGGGVSDIVANYHFVNNLQYNIDATTPQCNLAAIFTTRMAADNSGTNWPASVTRLNGVATAVLTGSDANANGQSRFHAGDPILVYNCSDTTFNSTPAFNSKVLGPPVLPGVDPTALTVTYANPGTDQSTPVTCTVNNLQGSPDHWFGAHNSDYGFTAGQAADPSSPALAGTHACTLTTAFTWINTISTFGGANAPPVGEGTRTTSCEMDELTEAYHHNAIPGRDTAVTCSGHAAGAGGIAACYTEYTTTHAAIVPQTLWGTSTPNCTTNNPATENCLGVRGNITTSSFNYALPNWHDYALCHGEAACNGQTSQYAAGGAFQADDGTDMGANFALFDQAQTSTLYVCPTACGTGPFPDVQSNNPQVFGPVVIRHAVIK